MSTLHLISSFMAAVSMRVGIAVGVVTVALGASLTPAQAAHIEPTFFSTSDSLPNNDSRYIGASDFHLSFDFSGLGGPLITIERPEHLAFTNIVSLPPGPPPRDPIGAMQTHQFDSFIGLLLCIEPPNCAFFDDLPTKVTTKITLLSMEDTNMDGTFDLFNYSNEMLQLDIMGLPAGVVFRLDEDRDSVGMTTLGEVTGGFRISSFFDVFAELSIDGGATFVKSPEAGHVHAVQIPEPSSLLLLLSGLVGIIAAVRSVSVSLRPTAIR